MAKQKRASSGNGHDGHGSRPASATRDELHRSVLPIPDQPHVGLTTYDARDPDTKYPPIRELRPPKGAPNVLVIMLDDVGYGAASTFGGPCATPNIDKLAAKGLRYTRFHTTALCSPTRQALLTGRNHHSAGMGSTTEFATSAVGGTIGGWSLYTKEGRPRYCYNFYGLSRYTVEGTTKLAAGTHQVRMEFAYDGGGIGKGGTVTLVVDGKKAGGGRVDRTEALLFSADETLDVGNEFGSPVTPDYPKQKKFSGEVSRVEIDVDKDAEDVDHLISFEGLSVAMALQ
jgi:hypothetical protein